ncbi:MAG: hypothetical protein LUH14_06980 [Clostridiaceae bacterium]|nr:hypothetical protein [Clostridiaceae bacterium]
MQFMKSKKVWLFFMLGVIVLCSVFFWAFRTGEKQVYANGRIVEQPVDENMDCLDGRAA